MALLSRFFEKLFGTSSDSQPQRRHISASELLSASYPYVYRLLYPCWEIDISHNLASRIQKSKNHDWRKQVVAEMRPQQLADFESDYNPGFLMLDEKGNDMNKEWSLANYWLAQQPTRWLSWKSVAKKINVSFHPEIIHDEIQAGLGLQIENEVSQTLSFLPSDMLEEPLFGALCETFSKNLLEGDFYFDGDPFWEGKVLSLDALLDQASFSFFPGTRLKSMVAGFELYTELDWPYAVVGLSDLNLLQWDHMEKVTPEIELLACPTGLIPSSFAPV